jgi:serine/threonine-protein kinase
MWATAKHTRPPRIARPHSKSRESVDLRRPEIQRLATLSDHDPLARDDLLGSDRAPAPALRAVVVLLPDERQHPGTRQRDHERDPYELPPKRIRPSLHDRCPPEVTLCGKASDAQGFDAVGSGNQELMPTTRPALPSRYAKPELLAYGGMAEVYRATDESLGRAVAVKVLSERYASDDELHARFLREARTAASLSGEPNVIVIHDVGETRRKLPFIVMELVSGGTVADRLRHERVSAERALVWLEQAAAALDRAHERGIVHRDVKPANLLVADDGAIRVSDFGIARAAGNDTLTIAGTVLGSSGYMAPEQARGEATTAASDRYALACVGYELLCGRRPFVRANPTAQAHAHATEEPPSPRALDASLPAALDAVFARALSKEPAARYSSCAAFVDDLRRALEPANATTAAATAATVVAAPPPAPPPTDVPVTRHSTPPRRTAVIVLAGGLLVAGALLAWGLSSLNGGDGGNTVVITETAQGRTVQRTVTQANTVTQTVESQGGGGGEGNDQGAPPANSSDGSALNDQGFQLLQQGDPQGALPLLESAVAALAGSGSTTEAYASYNLAWARFALGRCDGVAELLDRSEEIQGKRKEIDRLRRQVGKDCGD